MFYELRRHSQRYEAQRERVMKRENREGGVHNILKGNESSPEEYAKKWIEKKDNPSAMETDTIYQKLVEFTKKEDRDHLGMPRIHDLYQRYYLRFGRECNGLMVSKSGNNLSVPSRSTPLNEWNEKFKKKFEQVLDCDMLTH